MAVSLLAARIPGSEYNLTERKKNINSTLNFYSFLVKSLFCRDDTEILH